MVQPIKKKLLVRQSISQRNLHRKEENKSVTAAPIDTEDAPQFYVKFAQYMVEQERTKILDDYYRLSGNSRTLEEEKKK